MNMERYGRVYIDNGLQPNPFMESHTVWKFLKYDSAFKSSLILGNKNFFRPLCRPIILVVSRFHDRNFQPFGPS